MRLLSNPSTKERIKIEHPEYVQPDGTLPIDDQDFQFMFVSQRDEKVCPYCRALDGTTFELGDPDMPDIPWDTHPNCRCHYIVMVNGKPKVAAYKAAVDSHGNKGVWRTTKTGKHYFIKEGQSPKEALQEQFPEIFGTKKEPEKLPVIKRDKDFKDKKSKLNEDKNFIIHGDGTYTSKTNDLFTIKEKAELDFQV